MLKISPSSLVLKADDLAEYERHKVLWRTEQLQSEEPQYYRDNTNEHVTEVDAILKHRNEIGARIGKN